MILKDFIDVYDDAFLYVYWYDDGITYRIIDDRINCKNDDEETETTFIQWNNNDKITNLPMTRKVKYISAYEDDDGNTIFYIELK